MRKIKYITSAAILCMSLLGTGYAYWSDELIVSTTVSTGELRVDWVEAQMVPVFVNQVPEYEPGTILEGDKEAQFQINNMYPDGRSIYYANAENKGTMPVKILSINAQAVEEIKVTDQIYFSGYITFYPKGTGVDEQINFGLPSAKGIAGLNTSLDAAIAELNQQDLVPGCVVHFRIDMHMDPLTNNMYQDKETKLIMDVQWGQHNQLEK